MARWMSPELLDPDRFGFENSRPTKESDCYALGMVMLEVLSGQAPFSRCNGLIVLRKVVEGERPGRPRGAEGAWFTAELWEVLWRCWSPQPKSRPTVDTILEHLKQVSTAWQPPAPGACSDVVMDSDDELYSTASGPGRFHYSSLNPGLTFEWKVSGLQTPPLRLLPISSPSSESNLSQPPEKPDLEGTVGTVDEVGLLRLDVF